MARTFAGISLLLTLCAAAAAVASLASPTQSQSDADADGNASCHPALLFFERAYGAFFRWFALVWCSLGVVGNALVILVLQQRAMRSTTNTLMTAIASINLLVMSAYLPFSIISKHLSDEGAIYAAAFLFYLLIHVLLWGHLVSVWLTVLVAFFRLLYIKCPLKSHKLCTIRRARLASALCALLCALATIPFLLEHMVVPSSSVAAERGPGPGPGPTPKTSAEALGPIAATTTTATNVSADALEALTELEAGAFSDRHFYTINMRSLRPEAGVLEHFLGTLVFWMQALVNKIIPTLLLCALSIFLVVSMRKAERRRQMLRRPNASTAHKQSAGCRNPALNPVLAVQEPTVVEPAGNGFGTRAPGTRPSIRQTQTSSMGLRSETNGNSNLSAVPMLTPTSQSPAPSSLSQMDCMNDEATCMDRDADGDADGDADADADADNNNAVTDFPFKEVAPSILNSPATRSSPPTAAATLVEQTIENRCQSVSGNAADHRGRRTSRTTHLLLAICAIYICDYIPQSVVELLRAFGNRCIYTNVGDAMDTLSLLNNGTTFLIYCLMSAQFRATFVRVAIRPLCAGKLGAFFAMWTHWIGGNTAVGRTAAGSERFRVRPVPMAVSEGAPRPNSLAPALTPKWGSGRATPAASMSVAADNPAASTGRAAMATNLMTPTRLKQSS